MAKCRRRFTAGGHNSTLLKVVKDMHVEVQVSQTRNTLISFWDKMLKHRVQSIANPTVYHEVTYHSYNETNTTRKDRESHCNAIFGH